LQEIQRGNFLGRNPEGFAGVEKSVGICPGVFGQSDEKSAAGLDTGGRDLFEDEIFRKAFPPGLRIIHGVTGPAVKETVVSAGGTAGQFLFFEKDGIDSPEGEIPKNPGAGCPAANDHNFGF
jgi:hypothetical protein